MEMEYKDTSGRRGKAIIVLGLVLAVAAGGAAFFLINQAQQQAGQTIDIFATATVNVPQELLSEGRYYTDRSTKLTYQNVFILARSANFYVIRASIEVAEELAHLSAAGNVTFSAALRPDQDVRLVDASHLGATTNLIITRYGLPIPETYPAGGGVAPTLPPLEPSPTPSVEPSASPTP